MWHRDKIFLIFMRFIDVYVQVYIIFHILDISNWITLSLRTDTSFLFLLLSIHWLDIKAKSFLKADLYELFVFFFTSSTFWSSHLVENQWKAYFTSYCVVWSYRFISRIGSLYARETRLIWHNRLHTNHSYIIIANPLAAPVPARPKKCSLPMLLENSDAPTYITNTVNIGNDWI